MVLKVSLNTGINRIRLEFKVAPATANSAMMPRINRIRLEFKEVRGFANALKGDSINRIRLEFKVDRLSEGT